MGFESTDMPLIPRRGEVEFVRKLRAWFWDGPDYEKKTVDILQ